MKKIIGLLVGMLLCGGVASAQWSVGAGYVHAGLTRRAATERLGEKAAFDGVYAGIGYALPLGGGFRFTPGVYYEFLGRGEKTELVKLDFLGETQEQYLSVPLTFDFGVALSPDIRLVLFAGPTVRFGLSSITSYNLAWGIKGFEVLKGGLGDNNYNDDYYSRFDLLLSGGIALELLDHWRLQVCCDAGLLNRYIGEEEGTRMHSSRLTAGIAYLF